MGVQRAPSRVLSAALDLLFPRRCVGCDEEGSFLCARCEAALPRLAPPFCRLCAQPLTSGDVCGRCRETPLAGLEGIRAPYLMEGAVRDCVHRLKYQDFRASGRGPGGLLSAHASELSLPADRPGPRPAAPAPPPGTRLQPGSAAGARDGAADGLARGGAALRRSRAAPPQARSSDMEQRRRNVEGSFTVREGSLAGNAVLLVDDVCTTGSTLSACAAALKAAGASSVWAVTVAREA